MTDLTSNHDAERHVIARVLAWPPDFDTFAEDLQPKDFHSGPHAAIWQTMAALVGDGEAISVPMLRPRLDEQGREALNAAINDPPGISVASEVREVRRCALVRRQLAELGELSEDIKAGRGATRAQRLLQLEDQSRSRERYQTGSAFVFDERATAAPVWGQGSAVLWAAGEPFILVGPTGVGKTTITHQLIQARMGLADEVLGFPVAMHAGRILYLACDRPNQIRRAFRRVFTPDDATAMDEDLVVWEGPPTDDFAVNPDALYAMARMNKADTVVIDSVKDVVLNINEPAQGQALNRAFQTCVANGVEVLAMHHTRKKIPGTKRSIDDVFGGWLKDGAGSVVLLDGEPGDSEVKLLHLKQPADDVGPLTIVHDHDAGTSKVDRGKIDVLTVVSRIPGGMTVGELTELESETSNPSKNQLGKMRQRCERLVKSGQLHHRESKPGRTVYVAAVPERTHP